MPATIDRNHDVQNNKSGTTAVVLQPATEALSSTQRKHGVTFCSRRIDVQCSQSLEPASRPQPAVTSSHATVTVPVKLTHLLHS